MTILGPPALLDHYGVPGVPKIDKNRPRTALENRIPRLASTDRPILQHASSQPRRVASLRQGAFTALPQCASEALPVAQLRIPNPHGLPVLQHA